MEFDMSIEELHWKVLANIQYWQITEKVDLAH